MSQRNQSRREFLKTAAAAGAAATVTPYWITSRQAFGQRSKNDRHVIGAIGTGDRFISAIAPQLKHFGDVVAVCDADRAHMEQGRENVGGKAEMHEDYRKVLDRKEIDVVTITTVDHWHAKIAIEAMQAGKDVYVEKPLTLTIDEGKKICEAQRKTGQVCQVGTQQRSEFHVEDEEGNKLYEWQFLKAVALAHSGRLGKINRARIVLRGNPRSGEISKADVPSTLNWDLWQGQTSPVEYLEGGGQSSNKNYPASRCHYEFRWWYEYSGGKLTDWGAHHMDIAQWAIGMDQSGPTSVEGVGQHPVPFKDGYPTVDNQYNCATTFHVKYAFPNGCEILLDSGKEDSIWIEGEDGEIYVNRGRFRDIRGEAVAQLKDKPLEDELIRKLCKGKKPGWHMGNFFACVADRSMPVSDVFSHHRALTSCHLANISIRLNRPLKWDPEKEEIVGDDDANKWLAREPRKGFEITV